MYVHPAFAIDAAHALELAGKRGFGLLTAFDGMRPVGAHIPFLIERRSEGDIRLAFHVARNNAIATLADGAAEMLMVVIGPDAYVSPDWYQSKDQVSTWLYEAVHLAGPVRRLAEGEHLAHVDALSAEFEERLLPKKPWTSAKMTVARREAMLKGIIAMEMRVTRIEGARKLNQHKSDGDQVAMVRALGARPETGTRQIAAHMQALRPDLPYEGTAE